VMEVRDLWPASILRSRRDQQPGHSRRRWSGWKRRCTAPRPASSPSPRRFGRTSSSGGVGGGEDLHHSQRCRRLVLAPALASRRRWREALGLGDRFVVLLHRCPRHLPAAGRGVAGRRAPPGRPIESSLSSSAEGAEKAELDPHAN
jgi:hypothetical protein